MKIDFTMTGLNLSLLFGLVLVLQTICVLIMQNPFKHIRKFTARDFIVFAINICIGVLGIVLIVTGFITAFRAIG